MSYKTKCKLGEKARPAEVLEILTKYIIGWVTIILLYMKICINKSSIGCHLNGEMWQFLCANIQSPCERCMVRTDVV